MRLYDNSRTIEDEAAIRLTFNNAAKKLIPITPTPPMHTVNTLANNTMCSPAGKPKHRC